MSQYVLALDQGTTSSRAIVFDESARAVGMAQQEFEQIFPSPGHVEHDAEAIWDSQMATARAALVDAEIEASDLAALGIANQRETTVVWERETGRPVANAIVWQSRVTAERCAALKQAGYESVVRDKTGLVLDPYFSGTKIAHLLDEVEGLRSRAERGEVLFGTIDSFLAWRLTGGRRHVTDVSNASRTLLLNIHTLEWDEELLEIVGVPRAMLPEVVESSGVVGEIDADLLGAAVPLAGMAGDQQAATFGQACFSAGEAKNTYGTGCFLLMNTGSEAVRSEGGLLTTVGWSLNGEVTYCLEGSVFVGGAVVQWLRDGLGLISEASEIERLAAECDSTDGVYLVPAFVGLGAPYWDPAARGTLVGITRGTARPHLARAALESIAYQSRDLLQLMQREAGVSLGGLRVDGGAAANNLLMQFQADVLDVDVLRPEVLETTALGAARLAGLATGVWDSTDEVATAWQLERRFTCEMQAEKRDLLYAGWQRAVERSREWAE
ncbi:MAG: glycerol kinase GlpK [Planctomycetota bacterium]|nr:glycerol kinase GlpK [Planctomycetota bacterium]MED5447582.1 glycerol kinase GlpK [Planctomycetota bacterium]